MSLQGWQTLKCPKCNGTHFHAVYELIWQNQMGTTQRQHGHRCVGCNELADTLKMVTHAKKQEAEQKIKDLEAALG